MSGFNVAEALKKKSNVEQFDTRPFVQSLQRQAEAKSFDVAKAINTNNKPQLESVSSYGIAPKNFGLGTTAAVKFEAPQAGLPLPNLKIAESTKETTLGNKPMGIVEGVSKGVPALAKGVGTLAKDVAQGSMRAYAGLAGTVGPTLTPTGPLQEALYGTNKPISLRSVGEEIVPQGSKAAPFVGFLSGAIDLVGGGKVGRLAKELAKTSDVLTTEKVLSEAFPHLKNSSDFSEITKTISVETDPKKVQQILKYIEDNAPKVNKSVDGATVAQKSEVATEAATKERGFITSAKKIMPENDKIAGQYVSRSTDELSKEAVDLIKNNPVEAERRALTGTDDGAVAVASELIKKYSDDAKNATDDLIRNNAYDKAAEIANTLAPKLTELGRSIQAASILGRMSPEGQLRFAARQIQKFNESNPLKKIPELSGEQTGKILEEAKAIEEMPDGIEKAMRFQKLQGYVNDLVPTPLWKKITTIWKAGLLTGLKTTGLNLFSNLSHSVTEVAKDVPAAIVDSAAALFTGKRTKTATLRNAFEGAKEGAIKGKRYFATGFDERNIGGKLDYHKVNFGKGPVAAAFQAYTDAVFRVLGATDQPFYYAALSRSLMDQALANGKNLGLKGKELIDHAYKIVDNPTEEMLRYGVADATTAVFQNKTNLGEAAQKIQQLPGIGQIILPFAQTPSSVAMQIIAYSPVGAIKTIFENVGKGKFDQRLFSQGMGRSILGTSFLALGYQLAENKMVSLDFPKGDEAEQELQKAEGRKPNSILINGKWRSPTVLGPVGNVILMGAHFQKAVSESGSPTEAAAVAAGGVWKSFMEQTFLTGVSNFADVLQDPKQYASTYLPNLISSFVPTIVSDVARATDPLERKTQSGMSLNTVKERVQARIPFLRNQLQPDINILGEERQSVGNPLEILLDPTRPSPQSDSPVIKELRRMTDAGYRVSPTKLGDKNGYDILTPEQNTKLWENTGKILDSKLESLFTYPQYLKADDDQKEKIIDEFVTKSQVYSRAAMIVEITDGLVGEALLEKLSEIKQSGLLTRDVYKVYQEIR